MDKRIAAAPIRKSIVVEAPADHAFKVFALGMGGWWLKSHSIAASGQADVVIEPFVGGRWYERGKAGEECEWGRVLHWEPPRRLVLVWSLDADWVYRPDFHTELELTFTAEAAGRTRVVLEHRGLDAYAEAKRDAARDALDSERGWSGLLAAFAAAV
jgi:uncharacterized protein YndB with AHSA1/START domain